MTTPGRDDLRLTRVNLEKLIRENKYDAVVRAATLFLDELGDDIVRLAHQRLHQLEVFHRTGASCPRCFIPRPKDAMEACPACGCDVTITIGEK